MKNRLLASLGAALLLVPVVAGATSIGNPITWQGGPYLVGFEVETMKEDVDGQDLSSVRYLGRFAYRVQEPWTLTLRAGGSSIDVDSEIHGVPSGFEGRAKFAGGLGIGTSGDLASYDLGWFADLSGLYTLSSGGTDFTTTVQSSTFHERYEDRYRWAEFQGAGGVRRELPFGAAYVGLLGRTVDGKIWRETYQTGELVQSSQEDFGKGLDFFGLLGFHIRLPGRLLLTVGGQAQDRDHYAWSVGIAEFSH